MSLLPGSADQVDDIVGGGEGLEDRVAGQAEDREVSSSEARPWPEIGLLLGHHEGRADVLARRRMLRELGLAPVS